MKTTDTDKTKTVVRGMVPVLGGAIVVVAAVGMTLPLHHGGAQTNWTGGVDNDFSESGNWDNGVPDSADDGFIEDGSDVHIVSGTFQDNTAVVNVTDSGSRSTLRLEDTVNASNLDVTLDGAGTGFTGALSTTDSATASWAGGVTISSNGTRIGAGSGSTFEISGVIGGGGDWLYNPTDDTGDLRLSGANTYTGELEIRRGTVFAESNDAFGTTDDRVRINPINGSTAVHLGDGVSISGENIAVQGNGTNFAGALSTKDNATATWTGDVELESSARVGTGNGGDLTISGAITGSNNLTIRTRDNAGTVRLSGNSTYTGQTDVDVGTLEVASDNALGSTSGVRITNTGGTGQVILANGVTVDGTSIEIKGNGPDSVAALQAGNSSSATWNGDVSIASGNNARIGARNGGTLTVGGGISGGSGDDLLFRQTGADSTVILTGTNTYSGATDVAGGTLLVNGDSSGATGNVTVGALSQTTTLGGNGTIGGATTVTSDGTISPGTSVGTLTINNTLTLQDGAGIVFEFTDVNNADQIVGDELILPDLGAITLTVLGLDGHTISANDSFTIFDGTVTNFDTATINIDNQSDWTGGWEVSEGSLVLTAVPEPSTYGLLLALGVFGVALVRRRGRRNK